MSWKYSRSDWETSFRTNFRFPALLPEVSALDSVGSRALAALTWQDRRGGAEASSPEGLAGSDNGSWTGRLAPLLWAPSFVFHARCLLLLLVLVAWRWYGEEIGQRLGRHRKRTSDPQKLGVVLRPSKLYNSEA